MGGQYLFNYVVLLLLGLCCCHAEDVPTIPNFPGQRWGYKSLCHDLPGLPARIGAAEKLYSVYLEALQAGLGRELLGVEIGALHSPAKLPAFCKTTYVDYADLDTLRKVYPNMFIQQPDIIDDAVNLAKVNSDSYDYIITSHVMEHLPNFILSLDNQLRVLRAGGLVFLALPCMCGTFDQDRLVTNTDHFLAEWANTTLVAENEFEHFREWALSHIRGVFKRHAINEEVDKWSTHFHEAKYPIHYHTFLPSSLMDLLYTASTRVRRFRVLHFSASMHDIRAVLQRLPS